MNRRHQTLPNAVAACNGRERNGRSGLFEGMEGEWNGMGGEWNAMRRRMRVRMGMERNGIE